MQGHRVRVFLSESNWTDSVFYADNWFNAVKLAEGTSPIGRAIYLGEVLT